MPFAERRSLATAWTALAMALGACAVPLDDSTPDVRDDASVAVAESCVAAASSEVIGVTGRLQTIAQADGTTLVLADQLELPDTARPSATWSVRLGAAEPCPVALAPAPDAVAGGIDGAALDGDLALGLLGAFEADGAVYAFVSASRGLATEGVALARFDPAQARFVALPGFLVGPDRPTYGDAALVDDGWVYAYGCAPSGFLSEDCFVARAPVEALSDRTAWRYWRDGDDFGSDPDDAWPIFEGGRGLAVGRHADRVIAAYVTPLGDTITVRSGLGPTGPWSPPRAIARCAITAAGGFCGALALHPALGGASDEDALVVSYAIRSFEAGPVRERLTRLVRLALP